MYQLACHRLLPWLRVTFAMVPDAAWPGSDQCPRGTAPATGPVGGLGRPSASDPWGVGSDLFLGRPTCARVCGVLGHLAPVRRCARSVCGVACAASSATWLPFTGVPGQSLLCVCGVLGHLAPAHRCAHSVRCFVLAAPWATWLLFTGVPAWSVALRVRCPGPLGSRSLVCLLGVLCCVCGVLGHLAPVHRWACSMCSVQCAVSWPTRVLFTDVPAQCGLLRVRCPAPLRSCSPVRPLGVLCCVVCAVSWATWLLFTGVRAPSFALLVRCRGPHGTCSRVCPLGVLCCVCGVMSHLAPFHRCARLMRCSPCAVPLAPWLLFTNMPAWCVVSRVRCPGPLGSCSSVPPRGLLRCEYGVLGHLAPVHQCAGSVRCFARAVSWATWLLFTGVPARCAVMRVRCPGPLDSCSPVCQLGSLCCVYGVLGDSALVHRCARLVRCFACAVSFASSLLFTGSPARCVVLPVRCPGPLGSCSPVCPRGLLLSSCSVLGHLALVHRCACSVCCVACAVFWATWILFNSVPARCVVLRVRCPGPFCSCSPVCPLGVLCCVMCAVSLSTWLPFTSVLAQFVALRVRCPGPLGSCSPVRPLAALLCLCGLLGPLAPVHRCACSVCCVACAVSRATWLLFTTVPAQCAVLCVRCPGPLGTCSLKKVPARTGPCCTPSTISCHSYGLASHQVLHDLALSCTISGKKNSKIRLLHTNPYPLQ